VTDLLITFADWVEPAGRVDHDAVAGALREELARRLESGAIRLPAEGPIEVSRLRIDGALVAADRQADTAALAAALAQALTAALGGASDER
jgi:hypothetical protein